MFIFVFFFSSRRRHTRLVSDWSSDVCSSDLSMYGVEGAAVFHAQPGQRVNVEKSPVVDLAAGKSPMREPIEIGRASCRERVEVAVGGETLEKREQKKTNRGCEERRAKEWWTV